jgi:hypothetical protein
MRADFVASFVDLVHEFGILVGHPAKYKKRRMDFMAIKQSENSMRILYDMAWVTGPLFPLNMALKSGDLEIVFDVNCQCVSHGHVMF